jgi:hypothetical protein
MRMYDVPPTQRRDLLSRELGDKQRKSVLALAEKRQLEPALLDGVLAGIDSLCDPTPLPFNWDLSKVICWDPAAQPAVALGDNIVEEPFPYKYEAQEFVLIKPTPGAAESFWLARLQAVGGPNRRGEYEVWWLKPYNAAKPYETTWNPLYREGRQPWLDWQFEEGIQDAVPMVANGKKLSKVYAKIIMSFVTRWAQIEVEANHDVYMDDGPSDDPVGDDLHLN